MDNRAKWKSSDFKSPFQNWQPPPLIYSCSDDEKQALHTLKNAFAPLPPYKVMEQHAIEQNALVKVDGIPLPTGHIAFLENTAEQCTSPQTKHSSEGMQGARHWVQRVDTPEGVFQRLTDGYGISLMFGERCHQYIRNSNNWRGISGCLLDIDVFRDEKHPDAPAPVYSFDELFLRYPLIPRICAFVIPSASSLYKGRPFKARGLVLFPEPITDMRVYRQFGDILCGELDCIPQNVTKNPVAVGFGNTHNAAQAYRNERIDTAWISDRLQECAVDVIAETRHRDQVKQQKAERKAHSASQSGNGTGDGENISAFIDRCDALREMMSAGLLTPTRGNEYRWHESENDRSCEIFSDGVIHIFSHTMQAASPAPVLEPVNVHRFYLYQLAGLDLANDADKAKCREYLFDLGYGSDPSAYQSRKAKAKLQHHTEAEPEPNETLEANRANREKATDAFLTAETDTLHVFLVKDSTGTGKTYTLIGKAQHHDKRTLAQLPHTDLATQAVSIAWEHGYKNPYHLLGRAHNWDDSGIADIPVPARTADLFDRNNCIMFDAVQEYTEKRLAPRTYCEHRCGFRDGCLHLAQYEGLGQRDFIASCTPNLLFDLNMRGYLQSLVTATDEPTDEELAIDAILGTESEATPEFDFAIVDDYGINALYTDITFSQKEFKALKKAWRGTPTADFAKQLLKAFKKKKPTGILKALRNAFESTAEHHAEISEALTQHARNGIVEYAARPKGSQESQRLLSEKQVIYSDGGTQFIPVDFDAYKELTKKGIPTVHPQKIETQEIGEQARVPHTPTHALIAGVSVEKLTPIWQKGATPIELLDIFLNSIGNDKNAPINRTFRAGDPPEPVLTFSIPPQAPAGILPHIAMLSATTKPADTQHAFDGQPVTFSEHTGGNLQWADGVQVYQFQDARLTAGSVFEYPKDSDGKRKLQETPIGLTATAENRLAKLNDWAKAVEGKTAFISYKEFIDEPFGEAVEGFDIVTHFDRVAGLNFDDLKFLVVFGYPKVKHEILMGHARKQCASDNTPLPKADLSLTDDNGKPISEYIQLTEEAESVENGISITERRYKDPRLEKIRHQLATEKLDQAIGRARLPVWTDTNTLIFTDTPIGNITDRATLFSTAAFNLAETHSGLSEAMDRIQHAEATGDVKTVMETKQVSERTARRQTEATRDNKKAERDKQIIALHQQGKSQREIRDALGISLGTVNKVLKGVQKRTSPISTYNWTCPKMNTPDNPDRPCLEGDSDQEAEIFRRYDAGQTQEAIKDALGIGIATVNRVLNTRDF